jgi:hypothetical protein
MQGEAWKDDLKVKKENVGSNMKMKYLWGRWWREARERGRQDMINWSEVSGAANDLLIEVSGTANDMIY